jgi:hypothetical protein
MPSVAFIVGKGVEVINFLSSNRREQANRVER